MLSLAGLLGQVAALLLGLFGRRMRALGLFKGDLDHLFGQCLDLILVILRLLCLVFVITVFVEERSSLGVLLLRLYALILLVFDRLLIVLILIENGVNSVHFIRNPGEVIVFCGNCVALDLLGLLIKHILDATQVLAHLRVDVERLLQCVDLIGDHLLLRLDLLLAFVALLDRQFGVFDRLLGLS